MHKVCLYSTKWAEHILYYNIYLSSLKIKFDCLFTEDTLQFYSLLIFLVNKFTCLKKILLVIYVYAYICICYTDIYTYIILSFILWNLHHNRNARKSSHPRIFLG